MNQPQDYQHYYYASQPRGGASRQPPKPTPKPPKKYRGFKALLLIVVAAAIIYILLPSHTDKAINQDVKHVTTIKTAKQPMQTQPMVDTAALAQSINTVINANSNIDISVNVIDLNNGQAEHYGTSETFLAASTAKIITAEDFLHEVQTGQQSLSEQINGNTAEYELQQMIVVSDDNAWEALNDQLGYNQLQQYAANYGLTDYQAYNNVASSGDIATMLQKLWDNQLDLGTSNTQLLLGWLKAANYRQYIVPAIPADDTIYHKIGLYDDNVHDAAIITHGSQAFVLVIYTNGHGAMNWPARAVMMQQIAKACLKTYFNQ